MSVECVECPICESKMQFPLELASGKCVCPYCKHTFDIDASLHVKNQSSDSPANPPVIRPSPESQVDFAKPIPATLSDNAPGRFGQPAICDRTDSPILIEYRRHKKRKNIIFAVAIAGLLALIGIFGGIFVRNLEKQRSEQNAKAAQTSSTTDVAAGESPLLNQDESGDEPQSNTDIADVPVEPPTLPPPLPRFFSFRKSAVEECWKKTRPHLLSLEIDGPLGKRFATGTLVDSRGWLVTSYQAVKDAWEIQVTAATEPLDKRSPNDDDAAPPLTDLVRGFIATDPANDLALLSVNRRFVVSFADVQISPNNNLVQGEYLLQLGPPTPTNYYGQSEIKIENRSTADQLDSEAKSKAIALGLNSPTTTWLTTRGGTGTNPGMPLFRIDGTLAAITSFTKKENGYALPVHLLADLIRSADGKLTSLKAPLVRTKSGSAVSISADSPARSLTVDLNQSAEICIEFDWLPTNDKQYAELQKFSTAFSNANRFVQESKNDDDVEFVLDSIERWQESLSVILGERAVIEPQRLAKINQWAIKEIKKGDKTPVIFFGSIHAGGLESSRVILKFEQSETFANIPFHETGPVMRPGTQWIFFLETMPLSARKSVRLGNETIRTYSANIQFAIGPVE